MSKEVNLQEVEYNKISKKLSETHKQIINDLSKQSKEIKKLVAKGGCFQVNDLSPKIVELLSVIDSDLIEGFEQVFESSETSISSYIEIISNCDTIC
ncbi:hypothetical protein IBB39_08625 [Listeria seeligeri]|uniref:LXG domain-containing protein n=2 Tax=Listeria seeligeri TaxID=1640 RepID=A0ABR5EC15_LISSE|nr:hypothetical protein [Listeria seeligeri]EFS01631.1 hypothetical protein NT03LS_0153 [Listeria seeligeri FSL N1-067]KKD50567.1 hypothetical protein UQ68_01660 [Listeria seeligeri]MBC1577851.1 hypothetical protein [Listeria seeligeri]MBC1593858.1 hypothetical protein [Listeria seeligeri]MBC1916458.1 hypothetical protein [Listeria seeligeri]